MNSPTSSLHAVMRAGERGELMLRRGCRAATQKIEDHALVDPPSAVADDLAEGTRVVEFALTP